jgi:hypothetical protein
MPGVELGVGAAPGRMELVLPPPPPQAASNEVQVTNAKTRRGFDKRFIPPVVGPNFETN